MWVQMLIPSARPDRFMIFRGESGEDAREIGVNDARVGTSDMLKVYQGKCPENICTFTLLAEIPWTIRVGRRSVLRYFREVDGCAT